MARYIKEFRINTHPEIIHNSINQYLAKEGYEYTRYDNELVFQKGQGICSNPTFFKFTYIKNTVKMETWMKYALLPGVFVGELGIDGFVGFAVKGPWKKRITNLEGILCTLATQSDCYSSTHTRNTANDYIYEGKMPYSNEKDSFEKTYIMNESQADPINTPTFCSNCGTKMMEGALFCSECGQKIGNVSQQPNRCESYSQPIEPNNAFYSPEPVVAQAPADVKVTRKEFIEKYAQPHIGKEIRNIAILCYICAAITFIVSCIVNPIGIIDAFILTGFALGMHLAKSRVCAILILILSIVEMVLSLLVGSFPIWWLIAGVSAVVTFEKIEKQYKSFLSGGYRL